MSADIEHDMSKLTLADAAGAMLAMSSYLRGRAEFHAATAPETSALVWTHAFALQAGASYLMKEHSTRIKQVQDMFEKERRYD